jgi:serine/threonine protein kinase
MAYETNARPGAGRGAAAMSAELPADYRLRGSRGMEYRIRRVLGSGGFGITYEAEAANGYRVAIKELFPASITVRCPDGKVAPVGDSAPFQKMMESFYKESGVLYKLNQSGNFVKIYDYFNANNTCYYVMEYVEGDTLKERVRKRGVLDPRQWEKPFLQLMRDLSFLHAHDVIHRDIAPDNVKVLEDGTLKLIDFGLARPYMMDAQVTINLKPGFAPCEQYSSHGQGAYTDVYALAATMYYCFTGSVIPDAYERKVKDTIIAPRSLCPKLTARQERALLRALAVDYRQRIQNMQEFEKAYSSDVPVADPPPVGDPPAESGSRLKESLRVLREQPLLPAAAGLLFLIAAALQIAL